MTSPATFYVVCFDDQRGRYAAGHRFICHLRFEYATLHAASKAFTQPFSWLSLSKVAVPEELRDEADWSGWRMKQNRMGKKPRRTTDSVFSCFVLATDGMIDVSKLISLLSRDAGLNLWDVQPIFAGDPFDDDFFRDVFDIVGIWFADGAFEEGPSAELYDGILQRALRMWRVNTVKNRFNSTPFSGRLSLYDVFNLLKPLDGYREGPRRLPES